MVNAHTAQLLNDELQLDNLLKKNIKKEVESRKFYLDLNGITLVGSIIRLLMCSAPICISASVFPYNDRRYEQKECKFIRNDACDTTKIKVCHDDH